MEKFLNISDIEAQADSKPIWVLNTTNSCPAMRRNIDPATGKYKQERADVIINIVSTTGNSERATIVVPQSFLPVDCKEYTTKQDILASTQFRKLVREGYLTLISESYAEELFETEGADLERARLQEQRQRVRDALSNRGFEKAEVQNVSNPNENEQKVAIDQSSPEDGLDATFLANVQKWSLMDSAALLNDMKVSGKFSRKELKFVISSLDPVKHKDAIEHIQRILKKASKAK